MSASFPPNSSSQEATVNGGDRHPANSEIFFDLALDLLGVASMDGRFLRLNQAWKDQLGYELEELEGRLFLDLVHPDDVDATVEAMSDLSLGDQVVGFVNRYRAKSGGYRHLEWRSRPCPDSRQVIFAARDITSWHDLLAQYEQTRAAMQSVVEIAGVGGWRVDLLPDGSSRIHWDKVTRAIHEVDEDYEPDLEQAIAFYPPEARAPLEQAVQRCFEARAPYDLELPFVTAKGRAIWVRAMGHPIIQDGAVVAMEGIFQDVTAFKEHEQELEEARLAAEQANVAKSQFLANMSHEIRTPMSGLLGMLDLVLDGPLEGLQRSQLQTARDSAQGLLHILNDTLDYSKLDANQLQLEQVDFSIESLMDGVTSIMASRAQDKGVRVGFKLQKPIPQWVKGDANRLRQVLLNLVGNAIKFTEEGHVEMRAHWESERLTVQVADTGIGIPAEAQAQLFSRFMQADASTSRRYGGTGLGLAICKQLVELMGGQIQVSSAPGEGSVFTFWVPCAQGAAPADLQARTPPDVVELPKLRVLAAEDNRVNQLVLKSLLERFGHSVRLVDDGEEAVQAVQEEEFDLILMDVQMPRTDGVEATHRIRALPGRPARLPIVALTANAMEGDRERYLEAGMNDYAGKPIVRADLWSAMSRALKRST